MLINFSFATDLETKITNLFLDWDAAHNDKNIGLYDKLYSDKVNYYNGKDFTKMQILEDKIRILKKYPDFKQTSVITSKEKISDQIIKVNYEKNTSYSGKDKTFNSYLILNYKNEQVKIVEENDNKIAPKKKSDIKDTIKNEQLNMIKEENNANISWKDLNIASNDIWAWQEAGINSPQEAKKWIDLKLSWYEKKKWDKVNITSPQEISQWSKLHMSPREIQSYKEIGVNSASELIKWKELSFYTSDSIKESKEMGISSPEEAKEWLDTNFRHMSINYSKIAKLKKVGINSPSKLNEWKILTDNLDEVLDWQESNINTVEEAKAWKNSGFSPHEARNWKKANINNPLDAKKNEKLDIDSSEKKRWEKEGVNDSYEIKAWKDLGIMVYDIKKWKDIGINSALEVKEWKTTIGTSSESEILSWKNIGINSPKEVVLWSKIFNGYGDKDRIKRLKDNGFKDPFEILKFQKEVEDSDQIIGLKKVNINNINELKQWKKYISSIDKIIELKELGFNNPEEIKDFSPNKFSPSQVKILKELNIKPTPLIESMAHGISYVVIYNNNTSALGYASLFDTNEIFLNNLNILTKNNCENIIQKGFYTSDEYDNEGLCYVFFGTLIQRLDKTEGLLSTNLSTRNEFINYIVFDKSWQEKTFKVGIIKGMGSYRYETTDGDLKLVRKGKVLISIP